MPETQETKLQHIRGTTLRLTGWVKKLTAPTNDITGDILYFVFSKGDRKTKIGGANAASYDLTSPHPYITLTPGGKYTISLPSTLFTRGAVPDDLYWVQVDLRDAVSGDTVCVGRGEVEMLDNPRV